MATTEIKTRVQTFDECLLHLLADKNFVVDLPDHVFYLLDDMDVPNADTDAIIPVDTEYGDTLW